MSRTAEEAMLFAAMEGDQERLDDLAADTTSTERRYLTEALNRVYDALVKAEREPAGSDDTRKAGDE